MNDLPPESRPLPEPEPDATPTEAMRADEGAQSSKQRLRDRLWTFRAVIAVALASVIVGGLAGATLANVSNGGEGDRFGPGHRQFQRGGPGMPPGMMGDGSGRRFGGPDPRGRGQRQWDQDGQPAAPLTPYGTPTTPTPGN